MARKKQRRQYERRRASDRRHQDEGRRRKEGRVTGDVSLFCLSRGSRTAVRMTAVKGNGDRLIDGVVSAASMNGGNPIDG